MPSDRGEGPSTDPAYGIDVEPTDAAIVDIAVRRTLKSYKLNEGTENAICHMMARDSRSAVATSYYDDYNAKGLARSMLRSRKSKLFVDYVLNDVQSSALIDYAPEFELIFRNVDSHDHPMAAAMRAIDHAVINSRVPAKAKVNDIGGNTVFHIKQGNVNVHCCNPDLDSKDKARARLRHMAILRMARDAANYSAETRQMLDSYMSPNSKHFCSNKVQNCTVRANVITAIHVYDVPMQDWPLIMERKGASIVEGALLFSDRFLGEASGELLISGARYEIDTEKDLFQMGFAGSPSWWYTHKWSEFLRYAVDQRIVHGDHVYSYKVVERRADTIYFRIIAVKSQRDDHFDRLNIRHYKFPTVKMVQINGFDFASGLGSGTRDQLMRKTFMVAAPLWISLVNTATSEAERGPVDVLKMFNAYRTAAPRQTINGVLISGGYSVDVDQVKLVVVHAAIAGTARAMLSEKTNRALTAGAFAKRNQLAQSTGSKIVGLLSNALKLTFLAPLYLSGLSALIKSFQKKMYDYASMNMLTEIYDEEIMTVTCDRIFLRTDVSSIDDYVERNLGFSRLSAESTGFDLLIALESELDLAEPFVKDFGPQLTRSQLDRLNGAIARMRAVREANQSTLKPDNVAEVRKTDIERPSVCPRVEAIREAIVEIRMELNVTDSLCRRVYAQTVTGNRVINRSALLRDVESNDNPDLWEIRNGVLSNTSVRGIPTRDFCHSRLYLGPTVEFPYVKVTKSVWHDPRTGVDDVNYAIDDRDFNGYGLTCDPLLIFNGKEILDTLEKAATLDHSDYEITLEEGPPGCGKTFAIINSYQPSDIVLCPVKQSIEDTKTRLMERHGPSVKAKDCAKTVDSLLMHGIKSDAKFDRILADECFMAHAGKWYACAAILGVKTIKAYGDTKQIPHTPRVQCPAKHVRLQYDKHSFNNITRRCPADAVACWGHLYGGIVKTTNAITDSICEVESARGLQVTKDTCLMGMFQADKKEIRKLFPNHEVLAGPSMVITTHESEGKTYKEVVLFRFDRRIRRDNLSLYDKEPYVLVAMSRHTHKFTYVRPNGLNDLVSKFIAFKSDPRLVKSVVHDNVAKPNG